MCTDYWALKRHCNDERRVRVGLYISTRSHDVLGCVSIESLVVYSKTLYSVLCPIGSECSSIKIDVMRYLLGAVHTMWA